MMDETRFAAFRREGERVDDLQRGDLGILQRPDGFRFGTDAVLLADFVRLRPGNRVADLGAGGGILCLLLSQNEPTASFDAVEIQPDVADMARRSMEMNGLADRIAVHAMDMRGAAACLGYERFDAVVCNPPYWPGGSTERARKTENAARFQDLIGLGEIMAAGASLLRIGGRMNVVYPAGQAAALFEAARAKRLEPKRARLFQNHARAEARLILMEAVKLGKPGLSWMPTLMRLNDKGRESDEWARIYHIDT